MNTTLSTDSIISIRPFRFYYYLLTWISASIGIGFLCLSLTRYIRHKYQRTYLTYVYHFSLGFSILLFLISTPLHTLTEYYSSFIPMVSSQQHLLLCNFDIITFFITSSGIGYSLAYASLERTFFIFYSQNIQLTLIRQFTPFLIIFSFLSIIITLFVLLSKCALEISPCLICYFNSFKFQFLWFLLQFLIPFLIMLFAVIFLIYRINIHTKRMRSSITRKRSKNKFQRILIHLNIYNIYYMLSICPLNIYVFLRLSMNIKQQTIEILLINYSFISLHGYPILIFFLTKVKQPVRIKYFQEQKPAPYIIVTHPSSHVDEYERTRL
ncbi:unnamed protein product [Adineta steineri]|uniref:G-protein coupled receptors family 1 profile domain-containing protein n=1 Tax=Adineta steineri TaxID=433720 RepID=A0A819EYS3_9BILA|nr:unnamed protein product [Adineta steineri]CAF3858643.1 unnamed protein product [Adineta steineri]